MARPRRRFVRRPYPLRRPYSLIAFALLAALLLVRFWQTHRAPRPPDALGEGTYAVQRVVDGDTLLLANGARVRLIGVDAPESVRPDHPVEPFGPEAGDFARDFVAGGDGCVRLQFDRERVDRHGRFLAYVWVAGRMLNEELVRSGLATAETGFRYSDSMKRRFRRAEDEAKAAGRGMWGSEVPG